METVTVGKTKSVNIQRPAIKNDSFPDDDEEDETLTERLIGLTEMFPERFRTGVSKSVSLLGMGALSLLQLSKKATWIVATSATILVLPMMFETERAQLEEQQQQQQRQILLGPTAVVSGGGQQNLMPGLIQQS